jgi:hypothetical protein
MTGEWSYVTAAYAAAWICFIGYAVRLVRITMRARRDYDAARDALVRSL